RQMHYPDEVIQVAPRFVDDGRSIDEFFLAVVESVEEAILNSLVAATTMTGRDNRTVHALPHDRLLDLLREYRPGCGCQRRKGAVRPAAASSHSIAEGPDVTFGGTADDGCRLRLPDRLP